MKPTLKAAQSMLYATVVLGSYGCGLVFQGTTQRVLVTTTPAGATVSLGGHEATSPAEITLDRSQSFVVARASKEGYQSSCQLVRCPMNTPLVVFESIPAALPFLFDFALGTLRRCPRVEITLFQGPEGESARPLPSDTDVIAQWDSGRGRNICIPPAPIPPPEVWEASFDVALVSVDRPGQSKARYGPVERVGNITQADRVIPQFSYKDSNISITVVLVEDGIEFELENRTQHAEKIVWDEVVFVDFDKTSHRVIHDGVRYVDRNLSQPPSVVAPGKLLRDKMVPVSRIVARDDSFQHLPLVPVAYRRCDERKEDFIHSAEALKEGPFGVLFPVEIGGTINEYTLNFAIEGVQLRTANRCNPPALLSGQTVIKRSSW